MELTAQTVTSVINGVFAFFLVIGFLFGVMRGFKKSTLRFVFIVSIAAIMYLAAPYISGWLLNFDLSSALGGQTLEIGGEIHTITTLNALVTAFLESSAAVEEFVTANPSFVSLVEQLPLMITNLVIFLTGFWLFKIITWPVYAIMAMKYNKRLEDGSRPKKRRLGGGFIGVVQGTVIALITFMPIAGVSSMINVDGLASASGGSLLGDFAIPEEILEFMAIYENSAAGMLGGVGSADERMFDGLTVITVTDEETGETVKIRPRQEIETGMELVVNFVEIYEMFKDIEDGTLTEIDWDLVEETVNKLFELNTVELAVEQYVPYIAEELTAEDSVEYNETVDDMPASDDFRQFMLEFVESIDESSIENFRSDALALVRIGRALQDHGIEEMIFDLINEDITGDDFGQLVLEVFGTNEVVTEDIVSAILSAYHIKTLMPEAMNVGIGVIEEQLNDNALTVNPVTLVRIDTENIDWAEEEAIFTSIFHKLFVVAYEADPFNFDDKETLEIVDSLNVSELGAVIDLLISSDLFGGIYTNIIETVFDLNEVQSAQEYVDFNDIIARLSTTEWEAEFALIEEAIDFAVRIEGAEELVAEDVADLISRLDSSNLLDAVLDGAVRAIFIEGFEEEIGSFVDGEFVFYAEFEWLDDLNMSTISSNADFFAEVIEFSFFMANNDIETLSYGQIQDLVDAVQGVNDSENAAEFKAFFNEFIHYAMLKADADFIWANDLYIDDFIDNVDTMAEIFKLGVAITNETFESYTETEVDTLMAEIAELNNMSPELANVLQGIYDEFMLDSSIFVPIDVASINWVTESDVLKDAINIYLEYANNDTLNTTLVETMVGKFSTSYVLDTLFNSVLEEVLAEEEAPTWLASANIAWLSDNSTLTVELFSFALWTSDHNLEEVTQAQVDVLQIALDSVVQSSQELTDAVIYVQSYIDDVEAHIIPVV